MTAGFGSNAKMVNGLWMRAIQLPKHDGVNTNEDPYDEKQYKTFFFSVCRNECRAIKTTFKQFLTVGRPHTMFLDGRDDN